MKSSIDEGTKINQLSEVNLRDSEAGSKARDLAVSDATILAKCVEFRRTKCTSTKATTECKDRLSNRITEMVNWSKERDSVSLPKRVFSVEEVKKAHKKHVKLIKQKIKSLNACNLLSIKHTNMKASEASSVRSKKFSAKFFRKQSSIVKLSGIETPVDKYTHLSKSGLKSNF